MALDATNYFSSFDIGSGTNRLDYSQAMFAALRQDPNLLGRIRVGEETQDTVFRWIDDVLNAHQITVTASAASNDTALNLTANHGLRARIGTLLRPRLRNVSNGETLQVTATASGAVTVTRAYAGTAASIAANAVLDIVSQPLQEGSSAQADVSTARVQRTNATQIFEKTIQLSRNQLFRVMEAVPDEWTQQAKQRMFEIKRELNKAVIYGVANTTTAGGSDSQYRSMNGIDFWLQTSGGNNSTAAATISQANINTWAKNVWDDGGQPDTLLIGADLQQTVSAFDTSSVRRMESSRTRGYFVDYYMTDLGVPLEVVLDPYVVYDTGRGDAYVLSSDRISLHPFVNSAFFLLSNPDNADGRTGRVLGEYTLKVGNAADSAHQRATNVAAS